MPRDSNSIPEPATRSLTVADTRISPSSAAAAIRAPVLTAIPATLSPRSSHSPVWTPARISRPPRVAALMISCAHLIARAGPSNEAKKPSPAVSSSRPRNLAICRLDACWCFARRSRHARSPTAAARSVDRTMSVNSNVVSTLSGMSPRCGSARNRLSSGISSGTSHGDAISPRCTICALGSCCPSSCWPTSKARSPKLP